MKEFKIKATVFNYKNRSFNTPFKGIFKLSDIHISQYLLAIFQRVITVFMGVAYSVLNKTLIQIHALHPKTTPYRSGFQHNVLNAKASGMIVITTFNEDIKR